MMEIVKKQLALNDSVDLKPESKFSELGADSLDTVFLISPNLNIIILKLLEQIHD